jgi:hypothetical protein
MGTCVGPWWDGSYSPAASFLRVSGGAGASSSDPVVIPRTAWRWREAYRRHDAITIARLPEKTRTALGKQGATVARRKRRSRRGAA